MGTAQLTKTVHTARLGLEIDFLCFLGCMICLYVGVCFVLPWTVESFPYTVSQKNRTRLLCLMTPPKIKQ